MRHSYSLLLVIFLVSLGAQGSPRRPARHQPAGAAPLRLPARYAPLLNSRALQLTCYFTDLLRLTHRQAAEVRQATLLELAQQSHLVPTGPLPAPQQYDAAMMRILTPGQYSTFHWLRDRQPVTNLLTGTVAELAAK